MRVNDFLDTFSCINEKEEELKDNMYFNVYDMESNPIIESCLIKDYFSFSAERWDEFIVRGVQMLKAEDGNIDITLYVEEN